MLDVAIVGTGFAGIGMAIALRRAGIDSFVVLERASDVGGTWRDNRYPGCACDIPSMLYSFSFAPKAGWSRTFPAQPEIWAYLRDCVDREGIRPHIRLNSEVTQARYDEQARSWRVQIRGGETIRARVLVSAMGGLSNPLTPDIAGLREFRGDMFHSAQWDPAFDPAGKRIAVIGTGASAIQFVPELAKSAAQLTVFQRTPPWIIPRGDTPTSPLVRWLREHVPGYAWLVRQAIYWSLELRAYGFTVDTRLLALASRAAAAHLRAQVPDAALREKLTPRYAMGCKRILLSDDYYPALRRKNVTLVTDAIDRIAPGGVVTSDGTTHDVDAIVLGTGFRAQEFISPVQIFGIGGVSLDEAWKPFPRSYLGINVSGFPNLYFLIGPNTGLGHNSMVVMIEAQIAYVMSALKTMRARSVNAFDLKPAIERAFGDRIAQRTQRTVWASGCRSWYLDDRGQNTALWPGFTFTYRRMTSRFDPSRYIPS